MFNKTKTVTVSLVLATMLASTAQAHKVEITSKGAIRVTNTDATTQVVLTKSGGYRRAVVTSQVEHVRSDYSTEVFEVKTSAKVRLKKCSKRAKHCVQQELKHGSRLLRVIPAPPIQVVQDETSPMPSDVCRYDRVSNDSVVCGNVPGTDDPTMVQPTTPVVYPKPVVTCVFPDAWFIPPTPGFAYTPTASIWCDVESGEDDPVKDIRVTEGLQASRFDSSVYSYISKGACIPAATKECFEALYNVTTPGTFHFVVTVTTQSGQQAVFKGDATVHEGYPAGGNK